MKFWWDVNSRRVGEEKLAVEAIANCELWFELDRWIFHHANLAVLGTIIAHAVRYPVRLIYPDQFPEVPAWVEPQGDVKWTIHQYGSGGTLCLELRPDTWVPTATGADVLRSAYHLLEIENPLGEEGPREAAPSAHNIGEIQSYTWVHEPLFIGAGCSNRLRNGTAQVVQALRSVMDDRCITIVHDDEDRTSTRPPPSADFWSCRFDLPVYVSHHDAPAEAISRKSLIQAAGFAPAVIEQIGDEGPRLILFATHRSVTAYHLRDNAQPCQPRIYEIPDHADQRSGRTSQANEKKVVIVGSGSVGSKIAECLVRSGVFRLTLVDGDVMLPGNLERHTLDWRDVGFRKVHGTRRRLLHISSRAKIDIIEDNLNWQRSSHTHAWQVSTVADGDVIIDATGDAATSLFLGAVASANNRPFMSVEIFEGGLGALIASCLPGRDPPFAYARAAFLNWCNQQSDPVPLRPSARAYEAFAEDGAVLVADDASVTAAAGHAARVALDILDGKPAGPEAAWILLGFRKGWVFDRHGHVINMHVGSSAVPAGDPEDVEARKFVWALCREHLDADPSSE